MRKAAVLLVCLAAIAALAALQEEVLQIGREPVETCLTSGCHSDEGSFAAIAESFSSGVHAERGMTCYDCHRITTAHIEEGEPGAADRPPTPWQQPAACGRCHSDALVMKRFDPAPDITAERIYWTSRHGEAQGRLRDLAASGDLGSEDAAELASSVATCTSCHGVHGITKVENPRSPVFPQNVAATCGACHDDREAIANYFNALAAASPQLGADEKKIDLLASAVHDWSAESNVHRAALEDAGQLDAPTCNDCHGNHGASPPGALGSTRVAEICGVCHVQSYNDYDASPKFEIFSEMEYRDCYACHGNHAILRTNDEMIGLHEGSFCSSEDCHGDPDALGRDVIEGMRGEIDRLKAAQSRATEIIDEAERKGMGVENGRRKLVELNTALITARSKIHRFALEPVVEAAAPGFQHADEAVAIGEDALGELGFRQIGLAASSLIILFVAVLLFLKIRQIDKHRG